LVGAPAILHKKSPERVNKRITKQLRQGKEGIWYPSCNVRESRQSFSEVIIGISRAAEALIKGAFALSLFAAIKYGKIKASIISDC
jgi:hypothetical protein